MWFQNGRIPLWFEALPTERSAGPDRRLAHLDLLKPLRSLGVDAVNVPEIIGGQYQTIDHTKFAAGVQESTGLPVIANRVVVQEGLDGFRQWLNHCNTQSIGHHVLVGGEKSTTKYPGPTVTDALAAARNASSPDTTLGCITIPTRRRPELDEPERLLQKQAAGADFAISQILGESMSAARLQRDTAALASQNDVACLPLVWSLSPITRRKDIAFLKWLGVEIPTPYENKLNAAATVVERVEISHSTNESMARNLLEHAEREEHGPIGFCIEHVMRSNMAPAFDLVERIRDVTREFKVAPLARVR